MSTPPLAGTLVVALEQAVAVPFATRQLADLGARVIKIERPNGGDFARGYDTTVRGLSSHFVWLNRREWAPFCAIVLERPELGEDPRFQTNKLRVEHRAAMDSAILDVFRNLTAAEVIERLDRAEIANARINSVLRFIQHPQLTACHSWRQVNSPVGPVPALIPPARMRGVDPIMGAIPELAQHSESILAELGFDAGTITQWKSKHVF